MKPIKNSYSGSFKIDPGKNVLLNSGITGLDSIIEYSISNCNDSTKKDFHISASNIDGSQNLPCSSSTYTLNDLLIENKSGEIKSVDVNLVGLVGNAPIDPKIIPAPLPDRAD